MGAGPSSLEGHERVAATDYVGDEFPSGSSFFLVSDLDPTKCMTSEMSGRTTLRDVADLNNRKWLVEFYGQDRTKIALKSKESGKYLCLSNATWGGDTSAYNGPVYMYVYKSGRGNAVWLSTPQSLDCFLCAWEDGRIPHEVRNLTNKNGQGIGQGLELFTKNTAALSWRLQATPEYETAKEATPEGKAANERRRATAGTQGTAADEICCDRCGDNCKRVREEAAEIEEFKNHFGTCKACLETCRVTMEQLEQEKQDVMSKDSAMNRQIKATSDKEAELDRRELEINQREQDQASKEDALKQQEIDLQKRDQDLDARKKAVLAGEARSKSTSADEASLQSQRAEAAAHEQETQKKNEQFQQERQKNQASLSGLKAENAKLQDTISALKKQQEQSTTGAENLEKAKLQADLQHAREMLTELQQQNCSLQTAPASARVTKSSTAFTLASPETKMPPRSLGKLGTSTLSKPGNSMPSFSIAPPRGKLGTGSMVQERGELRRVLPQKLATA
ncbi:hypothetical protein LTR62_002943 [Meristemomyces frigidus]|uniref:Uncharacterized protein n=1 Tax=Meristemomyces frigidus TaxID=1508187 RepID=A0AAN7YJV2_9PEZI|nr:hypothetical protein LTR62_002943 [Meristemomyces frigidus]